MHLLQRLAERTGGGRTVAHVGDRPDVPLLEVPVELACAVEHCVRGQAVTPGQQYRARATTCATAGGQFGNLAISSSAALRTSVLPAPGGVNPGPGHIGDPGHIPTGHGSICASNPAAAVPQDRVLNQAGGNSGFKCGVCDKGLRALPEASIEEQCQAELKQQQQRQRHRPRIEL